MRPRKEGSAVVFEPRGDLATCSVWIRSVNGAARLQYERNNSSLGASDSRHSGLKTTNLCLVSADVVGTLMSTGIVRSKVVLKDGVGALQGLDGSSCGFLGRWSSGEDSSPDLPLLRIGHGSTRVHCPRASRCCTV